MATQKPKPNLSLLPLYYQKVNSRWYKDTRSGKWISARDIADYLPKEEITPKEPIQDWTRNYYGNT